MIKQKISRLIAGVEMLSHDGVLEERSPVAFLSAHHHVVHPCNVHKYFFCPPYSTSYINICSSIALCVALLTFSSHHCVKLYIHSFSLLHMLPPPTLLSILSFNSLSISENDCQTIQCMSKSSHNVRLWNCASAL